LSIDPYDHVICIQRYYRDLLVKMLKFAFLGVYGYTPYQCPMATAQIEHWHLPMLDLGINKEQPFFLNHHHHP